MGIVALKATSFNLQIAVPPALPVGMTVDAKCRCFYFQEAFKARRVGVMTGKALTFTEGFVDEVFSPGRVLVASEAKIWNCSQGLSRALGKMELVTGCTITVFDRLMDESVLKKDLVAVLRLSDPCGERYGQDDEKHQDVKS